MAKRSDLMGVTGGAETVIGSGVTAKGSLNSENDIIVDGTFNGDIKAGGSVTLGVNAIVRGNIKARSVTVSGDLTGNVAAAEELAISETGRITGDVTTMQLSIGAGAVFNGTAKMDVPLSVPAREEEITESE